MTIIEVKNQVLSHFFDKDTFIMSDDQGSIEIDDDVEEMREPLIRSALGDLESAGMVRRLATAENEAWILTQSFDTFNQNVVITSVTAEIIADTINMFREANHITGDVCDKTKIVEADILNLANVAHVLAETGESFGMGEDGEDE